eukprot:9502336-Pyramimonas_sp.AAC.1
MASGGPGASPPGHFRAAEPGPQHGLLGPPRPRPASCVAAVPRLLSASPGWSLSCWLALALVANLGSLVYLLNPVFRVD